MGVELMARAINHYYNYSPRVFISYLDERGMNKIPEFECKPVDETIRKHIEVSGCRVVSSMSNMDILYVVNSGNDFLATTDPKKADSLT